MLLAALSPALAACGDGPVGPPRPDPAPGLVAPLDAPARTANVFDHDVPFPFVADNGYLLSWWGEPIGLGIDGHAGYDFVVPEGTRVRAAAAGIVRVAGAETPFECPLLGQVVSGLRVTVRHALPGGDVETRYLHLSRIDVVPGERVEAGHQLGLSGNTGCSSGPHLHFQVHRSLRDGTAGPVVDPFGWDAAGSDPWADDPRGAASDVLWLPGAAPPLFGEVVTTVPAGAPVGMVRIRWMGVRDATSPDNEFVDVQKADDVAEVDLGGWTLRTNAADPWPIPAGTRLDAARPRVRVHVGASPDAGSLGMSRASGIIGNRGDCVQLESPTGVRYTIRIRTAECAMSLGAALRVVPIDEPGDAQARARSALVLSP